jgi:adenosine deaminase
MTVSLELLRAFPKVSLHDHLDGALRPQTVLELAAEIGHQLPADNADDLDAWFREAAGSGSLERFLETFTHTVAVMQTADNLHRVAREFVADLTADGVVYGEARWAPEQHTQGGLTLAAAIEAVRDGLAEGVGDAATHGRTIAVQQIVTSMRHAEPRTTIAELAVAYRDQGVAGFDIAGAEKGFPPDRFLPAFRYLREQNAVYTIHAGEADGLESIWSAVQLCAAHRIGHGVRIVDDIAVDGDGAPTLGRLASYVRDQQVPLEMCPASNVQTGAVRSVAEHPIRFLDDLGFAVTVNCDDQLMTGTRLSDEFHLLCDVLGYDLEGVRRLSLNAANAAFAPLPMRRQLVELISGHDPQTGAS